MDRTSLPSARDVRRRMVALSGLASLVTVALIAVYLVALLQLPHRQWVTFAWLLAILFPVFFAAVTVNNERLLRPLLRVLKAEEAGGSSGIVDVCAAFRCACSLPLTTFFTALLWWGGGGVAVAGSLWWRYGDAFGAFPFAVMVAAAMTGGFATTVLLCFALKAALEGARTALAERIVDPERRAALQTPVSLAAKLRVSVTGVILVATVFSVFLSLERSSRPVERNAAGIQARFLSAEREAIAAGGAALAAATARAQDLGIARDIRVTEGAGAGAPLEDSEWEEIARSGAATGTSVSIGSPNVFAWLRLDDGRLAVASTPWEELRGSRGDLEAPMAAALLLAIAVSLLLAQALGRDVGHAARELGVRAERMASGDLRPGAILESEDEIGSLARSFERMLNGLRDTVGAVARAADEVECSADEIATASQSVATVTADQVRGAQQAAESMELIHEQIAGAAESAQVLNGSVEEASSSVLELGAASEQLNGTAAVLFSKVEEVNASLGETVQRVKQVGEHTGALTEAAGATSSSMEEMAASMRAVDTTAEEAAALSRRMVATSEDGREKVRQTIEGMDSIRQATEAAEKVIRSLGERTKAIGAILDVIDSVADETNLLALNAAIIAAQAGEHGRGFAVVAGEIKQLADRVLTSTKEIGGVIRSVQEESENAVGAIERGSNSVAQGVDLSAQAGAALEEITRASRQSGERIQAIVSAVREQTGAAAHVVALMESVNQGVVYIRRASDDQARGNEVVLGSSVAMREIAQQVRSTTEEQSTGARGIRHNIEEVRASVEAINSSLQEQSAACRQLSSFLEKVSSRTRSNEESVGRMGDVTRTLLSQAERLREAVRLFRL